MDSLSSITPSHCPALYNVQSVKKELISHIAFHKIRDICSTPDLWQQLLKVAHKEILGHTSQKEDIHTSCITNFCALNLLFLGKEKSQEIFKILCFTTCFNIKFDVKKSDQVEKIDGLFHHFLSGNEILRQNKKFQNKSYEFRIDEIRESILNSQEFVNSLNLFGEKLIATCEGRGDRSLFGHCKNVLDHLESEIECNRAKTNEHSTFIYHVAITSPDYAVAVKGSKEEVMRSTIGYMHAFILEQYYNEAKGEIYLRLHSSWKDCLSLAASYSQMGYGSEDEGCFSQSDSALFFGHFRDMLCCGKISPSDIEGLAKAASACFKLPSDSDWIPPSAIFRLQEGIFTGLSLLYLTSHLSPEELLKNIEKATSVLQS